MESGLAPHRCLVVGIAGGTGSGKSTLARRMARRVGEDRCAIVTQDNYYKDLSHLSVAARARVNFDHPDSIDSPLLVEHVRQLKAGQSIVSPRYDFSRHGRAPGGIEIPAREVILVEGILVLVWPELVSLMDIKIFVETPDDLRLLRRMRRDIADRGRDVDGVLGQYQETVRPMHDAFVKPSSRHADLIVPGEGDNQVVVRFLSTALKSFLAEEP
ncbi:MAG: uridine kinase [Deltaproteobacteria bacterium]|jgi:uridine kinase|nr:uridine kinase [Deltaproteobacteria bacterium]